MAELALSNTELRTILRGLRKRRNADLKHIKTLDIRLNFISCYYACFGALFAHRPGKHMPKRALRLYMRYCKLATAEYTALLRQESPERIARFKAFRERAWLTYQAADRG